MPKSKKIIMQHIRKDLTIVVIIELMIIICLAVSLYGISKNGQDRAVLVNMLGKQRMLTQQIAKDATRKYTIIQAQEINNVAEPEEVVQEKLHKIQQNLETARDEFSQNLKQIKDGKIYAEDREIILGKSIEDISVELKATEKAWEEFDKSIGVVLSSGEIEEKFTESIIYINNNNEILLNYCNEITESAVNDKKDNENYFKTIAVILALVFIITMCISLYRLYKYLVLPLGVFIEGMNGIGMLKNRSSITKTTEKEVAPIVEEITSMSQKIERLVSLIQSINQNLSINEELQFIFDKFSFFIPYSYIGVALVKDGGKTLEASYGISDGSVKGMPENLLGRRFSITSTSLKSIVETGKPRVINNLQEYNEGKAVSEYNKIIMATGIRASVTLPLIASNKPIGIIFFSSTKKDIYNTEHLKFLEVIAQSLAISFERNLFVDNLLYSSTLALAKLAEARDEDTGEHLDRMKIYSKTITQFLYEDSLYKDQITPDYIDDIERFSPMHDIGKVGIRDGILLKPAKLTAEEFEEMKQHTVFGGKVLRTAEDNILKSGRSIFSVGIEIAEGHHEKWNGSGYPKGKYGQDIPLSARIVAVADVFDALTSNRPYKRAFSFEASYNYIIEGSGKHFDPEIVRVFNNNRERIWNLYKEFHGEKGILNDGLEVS